MLNRTIRVRGEVWEGLREVASVTGKGFSSPGEIVAILLAEWWEKRQEIERRQDETQG